MVNLALYPNMCDTTYGTPDSETLLATLMLLVIWLDRSEQPSADRPKSKTVTLGVVWSLAVFIWLNLLFGGLVNSVSTVDQILFGLNIGILLAFFSNAILKKPMDRHITRVMNGEF